MNFKNADLDQAIELARGELEKRNAWPIGAAHEIIWEDQPYLPHGVNPLAFVDGRLRTSGRRSGLNRGGLWNAVRMVCHTRTAAL